MQVKRGEISNIDFITIRGFSVTKGGMNLCYFVFNLAFHTMKLLKPLFTINHPNIIIIIIII